MRASVMIFLSVIAAGHFALAMAPPTTQPAASPTPPPKPCVGSIREYCQEGGGKCPTYAESVEGMKKHCKQPGNLHGIRVEHCVGGYRSIIRAMKGVMGVDLYFDASGKLVAAFVISDVTGAFCDGASQSKTYGRIPVCSTEYVKIDVCKP